jgi:hypothetical protein
MTAWSARRFIPRACWLRENNSIMIRLIVALAAVACVPLHAQGRASNSNLLLVGQFRAPLGYEAALQRLDGYYQEQVGRKLAMALPEIAPRVHFDVWHDMWITFTPEGDGISVTIKRAADSVTNQFTKTSMLAIAGRLQGEMPMSFQETPPLSIAESDLYASRRDLTAALEAQPAIKPLFTWQHVGLFVSATPMAAIKLESAGLHGVHHVIVTAESAAAAKQLLAKLTASMTKSCVCAAYSESAEIDEEIRSGAKEQADDVGATTAQKLYVGHVDPLLIEGKLRGQPEMQARIAAAKGYYDIRYRVDKPYAKVTVRWSELTGYTREDGKFQGERPLGQSSIINPRPTPQAGAQLTGRSKLGTLPPGAYRIAIDGETSAGQKALLDQRDFWFDGKTFEEL